VSFRALNLPTYLSSRRCFESFAKCSVLRLAAILCGVGVIKSSDHEEQFCLKQQFGEFELPKVFLSHLKSCFVLSLI